MQKEINDLNEIIRYKYDTLGRLVLSDISDIEEVTEEGETEVSETNKVTTAYSYDKVGNRVSKTENGVETVYEYNGLDQLIRETTDGDPLRCSYDGNGNQIWVWGTVENESVSREFTYTPSGMMETYSEDDVIRQENLYTGDGQRIRKTEGDEVTNYFYQEGSVLYTTGDGESFDLLNISDVFGTVREDDDYYFYLEDIQGSTVNLIDSDASKVRSYWYNDFGGVAEEEGSGYGDFVNELQYTGAIYDDTTSLLYLNARFYDPTTGRFISKDTYRGEYEEPDTWHLYVYCANDPVNYVDPSGHFRSLVGKGIQVAFTIGGEKATFALGFDLIWFNDKVEERYGDKKFHFYYSVSFGTAAVTKESIINAVADNPKLLLSKCKLKKLRKILIALLGIKLTITVQLMGVWNTNEKFKSYLNYEGPGTYSGFSMMHITGSSVNGSSYICTSAGYSTSKAPSFSFGVVYSIFDAKRTDDLRKVMKKIRKKIERRVNNIGFVNTHHR